MKPLSGSLKFVVSLGWVIATIVPAYGQTWSNTLISEASTNLAFLNGNSTPRTTTYSLQSPVMPTTDTGANDDGNHFYPYGSGVTPPWWFTYTNGNFTATDLTGTIPYRYPTNGQISFVKPNVYGVRSRAAFTGSGSGQGYGIEAIFVGEREDWAGQREFGFARSLNEPNTVTFYWSINSNCSQGDNAGYPYCRSYQAPNPPAQENPTNAPLVREELFSFPIYNVNCSVQSMWVGYLFWASWDSSYKFRVEQWDSTYSTPIIGFNVDTTLYSNGTPVSLGLTTNGMTGYVNLTATRKPPFSASTNAQLVVGSVEYAH